MVAMAPTGSGHVDPFGRAMAEYRRLRSLRDAEQLSDDDFQTALRELVVEQGHRRWRIRTTGAWELQSGDVWIKAEPPGPTYRGHAPPDPGPRTQRT
jgi:hypothetical protein